MLYVRYALSLGKVEDPLHERGIENSHETLRFWWNRFGPMFAPAGTFEGQPHRRSYRVVSKLCGLKVDWFGQTETGSHWSDTNRVLFEVHSQPS